MIEAFTNTHNFNILYFSETPLDSTIVRNNRNINIDSYSSLRADHPSNSYSIPRSDHPSNNKRRSACIYFKQSLPLIRRDDLSMMQ